VLESPAILAEASTSITAAYWHHHFRQLFQKQLLLLLLPTLCDLLGSALLNIGEAALWGMHDIVLTQDGCL
jgi:hypothetical protein